MMYCNTSQVRFFLNQSTTQCLRPLQPSTTTRTADPLQPSTTADQLQPSTTTQPTTIATQVDADRHG